MKLHRIAFICLFAVFIIDTLFAGSQGDLELLLTTGNKMVRLGEPITFTLIIRGNAVSKIISGTKDMVPVEQGTGGSIEIEGFFEPDFFRRATSSPKPSEGFVYEFAIKPAAAGEITVGPYQIEFQGKKLVSNAFTIDVYEVPEDTLLIIIKPEALEAKKGEPFDLVIEHGIFGLEEIELKENPDFKVESKSTSKTFRSIEGSKDVIVSTTKFTITPLKEGEIKFDRESIADLPKDVYVPETLIRVK